MTKEQLIQLFLESAERYEANAEKTTDAFERGLYSGNALTARWAANALKDCLD